MKLIFFTAVTAVLLSSCSGKDNSTASMKEAELTRTVMNQEALPPAPEKTEDRMAAPDTAVNRNDHEPQSSKTTTHQDWDKKIIKTANITLQLREYAGYNKQLHTGLKAYGAYIASEEQKQDDYRIANTVTIKVPVEQFDNLVNSFSGEGIKLLEKRISSEDVTGEVVDTRSRIEAKKQVRDRYLQLLKQASNMKEILEVQREINSIQEDLESASGRVGYLTHQAAYSTIHLEYFQFINGVSHDDRSGFFVRLTEGFQEGFTAIGNLLIVLVSFWPILIIITGLFIWLRKKRLSRQS